MITELFLAVGGVMLSLLGWGIATYARLRDRFRDEAHQKFREKLENDSQRRIDRIEKIRTEKWFVGHPLLDEIIASNPPPIPTSDQSFPEWIRARNEWQREIEEEYPPLSWSAPSGSARQEELKPLPRYKSPDRCPYCNRTKVGSDFCLGCGAPL